MRDTAPTLPVAALIVSGLTDPGTSQSRGPTDSEVTSEVTMNNSSTPQTKAEPAKAPATYKPIPAQDAVTTVPGPAKGNDEVMSQQPAKQS